MLASIAKTTVTAPVCPFDALCGASSLSITSSQGPTVTPTMIAVTSSEKFYEANSCSLFNLNSSKNSCSDSPRTVTTGGPVHTLRIIYQRSAAATVMSRGPFPIERTRSLIFIY